MIVDTKEQASWSVFSCHGYMSRYDWRQNLLKTSSFLLLRRFRSSALSEAFKLLSLFTVIIIIMIIIIETKAKKGIRHYRMILCALFTSIEVWYDSMRENNRCSHPGSTTSQQWYIPKERNSCFHLSWLECCSFKSRFSFQLLFFFVTPSQRVQFKIKLTGCLVMIRKRFSLIFNRHA